MQSDCFAWILFVLAFPIPWRMLARRRLSVSHGNSPLLLSAKLAERAILHLFSLLARRDIDPREPIGRNPWEEIRGNHVKRSSA